MATVILKAIEACNARCAYCDVVHKKSSKAKNMNLKTLELFFARTNEFLLERPRENMEIIWHGGEPLLLGPDYFIQAFEFQQKLCSKTGHRIRHALQSNLTLFSKKFVDIFRKLGIKNLGTSYDPFSSLRKLGSKRDSHDYNRLFMECIGLVEREGFGWGVIYVVTKLSLEKPLEIFHFLTNLNPKGSIMFNPVLLYDERLEHLKITAEEFVEFLGAIFPTWWQNKELYEAVEPFSSLTKNIIQGHHALSCCDSGKCAYSHINVGPDGSISHCGRSYDWGLLDYGTISHRSFSEVLADPQRHVLLQRNEALSNGDCKGCNFWSICHGGCPLDAWSGSKSFMHKSPWCYSKKGFIEKYFNPVTGSDSVLKRRLNADNAGLSPTGDFKEHKQSRSIRKANTENTDNELWINPIGGLGDTLMLSGVLTQVIEKSPSQKFNLVTRTKYNSILNGHPAINKIGHPPLDARFIGCNYWDQMDYGPQGQRPYQILARMFGLRTPVEERLYVPWSLEDDPLLSKAIPWKKWNILICPSSYSPRKQMDAEKWESFVALAVKNNIGVVQAGENRNRYIRGSYSLLGLTSPKEIISLIKHFDAVVTSDNFLMHAAHLCEVPAVVVWGPSDHRIYGYREQIHFQSRPTCDFPGGCIGPGRGHLYPTECPEGHNQCINQINVESMYKAVQKVLLNKETRRSNIYINK